MKQINNPIELASKASSEYYDCYKEDLVSVILYGSAAGGDFNPKTSDINLLVVLKEAVIGNMVKSDEIQKKYLKERFSRPLFMDMDYIKSSLDSFPIEFLNMKNCHKVLTGEDILENLVIDKADLRLQIERELKGKRLHLTQQWLEVRNKPRLVKELLIASLRDFSACFRALLHLKEKDVPQDRTELFSAIEKTYEFNNRPFGKIVDAYKSSDKKGMIDAFPEYAYAIKRLTEFIDEEEKNIK